MKRGTQIAYVPRHANGNLDHLDVQTGFVTSVRGDFAFCRYWSQVNPLELRTKANSEATPMSLLEEINSVPQAMVDELLEVLP